MSGTSIIAQFSMPLTQIWRRITLLDHLGDFWSWGRFDCNHLIPTFFVCREVYFSTSNTYQAFDKPGRDK